MQRKYIFEVETPQHAICPPMRYFKPMEAVSFCLLQQRNDTVFRFRVIYIDIVSMNVIRVTLVFHKVNMFSSCSARIYLVETKFNFVIRRQKDLKMSYR